MCIVVFAGVCAKRCALYTVLPLACSRRFSRSLLPFRALPHQGKVILSAQNLSIVGEDFACENRLIGRHAYSSVTLSPADTAGLHTGVQQAGENCERVRAEGQMRGESGGGVEQCRTEAAIEERKDMSTRVMSSNARPAGAGSLPVVDGQWVLVKGGGGNVSRLCCLVGADPAAAGAREDVAAVSCPAALVFFELFCLPLPHRPFKTRSDPAPSTTLPHVSARPYVRSPCAWALLLCLSRWR